MSGKISRYKTQFVEYIPEKIDAGILYISIKYNVTVHSCACGCGVEIVAPLDENSGWILKYDGENGSLYPSIGNGKYECKSHYYLTNGKVEWLRSFEGSESRRKKEKISWIDKLKHLCGK